MYPHLATEPLSVEMLEAAFDAAAVVRVPAPILVGPAMYEDLQRRYAWQAENPTHDIWAGYNWHHGMRQAVIDAGLKSRRRARAARRSRRNSNRDRLQK